MTNASIDYHIGNQYHWIPTSENPVWMLVHNYTQRDLNKSATQNDYKSAKFVNSSSTTPEPIALLRYEREYYPAKYKFFAPGSNELARVMRGTANSGNPNGLDLLVDGQYTNDYLKIPQDFRDWWMDLQYKVDDSVTEDENGTVKINHDGRGTLLSQMSEAGIIDCINNFDIPAALNIINNTKKIDHVSWQVVRDPLIEILEARLVNHWHLMTPKQQAKHTKYIPPEGDS